MIGIDILDQFRCDWFKHAKINFEIYLEKFKNKSNLRFLEIGSFEGMSTLWLLENILTDASCKITCVDTFVGNEERYWIGTDTSNIFHTFNNNISKHKDKVIILKGKSQEQLRRDEFRYPIYDFIYIDGSHRAPDTLEDIILSFRLLKPLGIMILDDYQWDFPVDDDIEHPKMAIDAFLSIFKKEYKLLLKDYQAVIEKLPEEDKNKKILGLGYYVDEIAKGDMTLEKFLEIEKIKKVVIDAGAGYENIQGFPVKQNGYFIQQYPDEFAEMVVYLRHLNRTFQYGIDIGIASGGATKLLRDFIDIKHTIVIDTGDHAHYIHWQRIKKELNSKLVTDIIGNTRSHEVIESLKSYKGKIDFAFIDGDHSYKGVKADYFTILPLLVDKAILIFHDSRHDHFGIKRLVNELQKDERLKLLKDIQIRDGITIFEKIK